MFFMPGVYTGDAKADAIIAERLNNKHQWDELDKGIEEYNSRVTILDEDYSSFEPFNQVIVRCFHKETQKSNGIIISPPKVHVPERTQNGIGIRATVEAPWAYSVKAVVVAVPEGFNHYKPGDVVQLHKQCIIPEKPSVDHDFLLPMAFTLPEYSDFSPPSSKTDKHYGYLLVDPFRYILGKFKNKENGKEESRSES
jgi:hypothetical protein